MRSVFFCIDGHTAGNPVRLVVGGAPFLAGSSMSERRQDFLARYDWIRLGLMFEPRGHDMMSGGFLYPPFDPANDAAILFMETSTGTSARLAHLAGTGRLREGEPFVHESIIGSRFIGRVRQTLDLHGTPAIIPSIEGSAFATGLNTLWIDPAQPFPTGFQVT